MRALRRVFGSEMDLVRRYLLRRKPSPAFRTCRSARPLRTSRAAEPVAEARRRRRAAGAPLPARTETDEEARRLGVAQECLRDACRAIIQRRGLLTAGGLSVVFHAALALLFWEVPFSSRQEPEPEEFRISLRVRQTARAPEPENSKKQPDTDPAPLAHAPPLPEQSPPLPEPVVAIDPVLASFAGPHTPSRAVDQGFTGTGDIARPEPEGSPGPPAILGVGSSPPPGDGHGRGGDGKGDGWGSRTRGRAGALSRFGGGGTEDAVTRGLAWLAAHQDSDGGWSAAGFGRNCRHPGSCLGNGLEEFDTGVTALAVLAFLGAGQVPGGDGPGGNGPYSLTVARALASLIAGQRPEGALGARGQKFMYNHSIATFALCEAYAMSRDPTYLKPAMAALAFTAASQQLGGGWDYTDARTGRNDLSITAWQVMALRAAETAGFPVAPEVKGSLRNYLRGALRPGGEAIYANAGIGEGRRGVNMSAAALLCHLYLGGGIDDPWVLASADRILRSPPEPDLLYDWDRNFQSSYYWYCASLTLFHLGGARWDAWNHFLKGSILRMQSLRGPDEGSWPPDGNWIGAMGGRVYSTAINVLTLEVYYRYPPLHAYRAAPSPRKS